MRRETNEFLSKTLRADARLPASQLLHRLFNPVERNHFDAPGVNITGNSGLMGSSSDIRIRGGFGEPLFVIDGIVRDKNAFDALEVNEIDQLRAS